MALNRGGAFNMFDKVREPDARSQGMMRTLHTDLRQDDGFDTRAIVDETLSLKGVLEPFSNQRDPDMLAPAGFADTMTGFKHLCFEGFLSNKRNRRRRQGMDFHATMNHASFTARCCWTTRAATRSFDTPA